MMLKGREFDALPLPGFNTVTGWVPRLAMSKALIVASNFVLLM
jgi:hypothetical protein